MKKDAYYFPHYYNARSDRKLMRVRRELNVEGYGIYFMLLEVLREQTDFSYPIEDIDLLADDFRTSEQKIKTVIFNYGLFEITDDKFFYSQKLIANLQPYIEKSERARLAARKRWENSKKIVCKSNANAEQMECESECKEKRGEEKRREDISSGEQNFKNTSFKKWDIEMFKDSIRDANKNNEYDDSLRLSFYNHWIEPNDKGKMKFQLNETWSTKGRLTTFKRNREAWNKK